MATHAAGVVIAGENLSKQVPLYKDHSADLILPSTQFDMHSSENAGLVKFDILGLTALTVIDKTVKLLAQKKISLDISKINLQDQNVDGRYNQEIIDLTRLIIDDYNACRQSAIADQWIERLEGTYIPDRNQ